MAASQNQWLTLPLVAMVISAITAYFASQINQERRLGGIKGDITAIQLQIDVMNRWMDRTEKSRFTSRDGDNLSNFMSRRLDTHENLPAHGDIRPRLSILESQIKELLKKISVSPGDIPPWDAK